MRAPASFRAVLATLLGALVAWGARAVSGDEPPPARAQEIRARVVADLESRPYLRPGWVRVTVDRSRAALEGSVPEEIYRAVALLAAENTPGVSAVRNGLEIDASLVRWQPLRGEEARVGARNARNVIAAEPRLSLFPTLRVVASLERIRVRGTVERRSDMLRALGLIEEAAHLPAPFLEVVNELEVNENAPRSGPPALPSTRDRLLARAVEDAIREDPLLEGAASVKASVLGWRLVLTGRAADLVVHDYVVEIARARLAQDMREHPRKPAVDTGEPAEGADSGSPDTVVSWIVVERCVRPPRPSGS